MGYKVIQYSISGDQLKLLEDRAAQKKQSVGLYSKQVVLEALEEKIEQLETQPDLKEIKSELKDLKLELTSLKTDRSVLDFQKEEIEALREKIQQSEKEIARLEQLLSKSDLHGKYLTDAQVAEQMGVASATITRYRTGKRSPSPEFWEKWAVHGTRWVAK